MPGYVSPNSVPGNSTASNNSLSLILALTGSTKSAGPPIPFSYTDLLPYLNEVTTPDSVKEVCPAVYRRQPYTGKFVSIESDRENTPYCKNPDSDYADYSAALTTIQKETNTVVPSSEGNALIKEYRAKFRSEFKVNSDAAVNVEFIPITRDTTS